MPLWYIHPDSYESSVFSGFPTCITGIATFNPDFVTVVVRFVFLEKAQVLVVLTHWSNSSVSISDQILTSRFSTSSRTENMRVTQRRNSLPTLPTMPTVKTE